MLSFRYIYQLYLNATPPVICTYEGLRIKVLWRIKAGHAKRRVWSARPDPWAHKHDGVLRSAHTVPSGPRATSAPTRSKERGCTQASANAGPPSRRKRNSAKKSRISSRPKPSCPNRPSTNIPAGPSADTGTYHLQYHCQGILNRTQPQRSRVSGHLCPTIRRVAHNPPLAARETCDLAPRGEATACGVPWGPRATHPCALGCSVRDPVLCKANNGGR